MYVGAGREFHARGRGNARFEEESTEFDKLAYMYNDTYW